MTSDHGETPRVFIIDDDEAVRDAMGMLLETRDIPNLAFKSADQFIEYYDGTQRGCLVLDIRMPGKTGIDLQQELKQCDAALPIIFITGHGDIPMAVEAMRQGAVDFMRKPIVETDLLNRIEEALNSESGLHQETWTKEKNLARIGTLTEREFQVFSLVAEGQTNKVIAIDLGISERTVEVHRAQVMKKLGTRTLAQLIKMWISVGDAFSESKAIDADL